MLPSSNKLYKYRSLNNLDRLLDSIINGKVFFPDINKLNEVNDPFEYDFTISYEAPLDVKLSYLSENFPEKYKIIKGMSKNEQDRYFFEKERKLRENEEKTKSDIKRRFKVASFSSTWKNINQWTHYAQGHSGVCLEYSNLDKTELKNSFFNVKYKNKKPLYYFYRESNQSSAFEIHTTKHHSFYNEQEYRLIGDSETGTEILGSNGVIQRIFLGLNFSINENIDFLSKLKTKKPNLNIVILKKITRPEYGLEIQEQKPVCNFQL